MPVRRVDLNDYTLDLQHAAGDAGAALERGELLVLPTETVYGIAARLNVPAAQEALTKLRGDNDMPLTPHLSTPAEAEQFVGTLGPMAQRLTAKLWPGPVALVFEVEPAQQQNAAAAMQVQPAALFAADGHITLRCPDEPVVSAILAVAGQPTIVTRVGLPTGTEATRPPTDTDIANLPVTTVYDMGRTRYGRPSTVIRISPDGQSWDVVREGIYDRRIIERLMRTTLAFVCSGNTCRSPMAMALGRKELAKAIGVDVSKLGERGYDVISAGTSAMPGMRATPAAAVAVETMGAELAAHRSAPLDVATIHRADLIVTMSEAHRDAVLNMVPSARTKTVLLDPDGDIEDPIGAGPSHYRELAERMEALVQQQLTKFIAAHPPSP